MKPDRSNYEIWFTDWLDGTLSEQQAEEFKQFLKENPDLEAELNGLDLVTLNSSPVTFNRKKQLEKSPDALSESQFELLCIGYLENDISSEQKAELDEIIRKDKKKRKTFELIQNLRLKPLPGAFERKSYVKRLTPGYKTLRLSVIGLSAAATIALIISIYLLSLLNTKRESIRSAENITPDTLFIRQQQAIFKNEKAEPVFAEAVQKQSSKRKNPYMPPTKADVSLTEVHITEAFNQGNTDSVPARQGFEAFSMLEVAVPVHISFAGNPESNTLISYNPDYVPPLIDDRSNVQRFLARVFRERILRDTIAPNRPVKSYEIAQAGIKGLNKLFGWELALHKNTDENGDTRSYNFSSRMLKFNAPVKKQVREL